MLYDQTQTRTFENSAQDRFIGLRKDVGIFVTHPDILVLVVRNSDSAGDELGNILISGGFACHTVTGTLEARAALELNQFDLIVLEGRLDGGGSIAFCQFLASHIACPVIVIDRGSDVLDRVIALEAGADDYLSQPVNEREILARARALVRRQRLWRNEMGGAERPAPSSRWTWNLRTRQLMGPKGKPVVLTAHEQELLSAFLDHPGQPLTPEAAQRYLNGSTSLNHFRTSIVRLRRKLAAAGFPKTTIRTLRLGGYVFDADVASGGILA